VQIAEHVDLGHLGQTGPACVWLKSGVLPGEGAGIVVGTNTALKIARPATAAGYPCTTWAHC
jgi:hypothetical protein